MDALANAPTNASARCTGMNEWVKLRYSPEDCRIAVSDIFGQDVRTYGEIKLEFIRLVTDPSGQLPFIQKPRKYRFRSCIVAIVMLDLFPKSRPELVPGSGPSPFPSTDISTLREASTAATDTLYGCVQRKSGLGWSATGKGLVFLKSISDTPIDYWE